MGGILLDGGAHVHFLLFFHCVSKGLSQLPWLVGAMRTEYSTCRYKPRVCSGYGAIRF